MRPWPTAAWLRPSRAPTRSTSLCSRQGLKEKELECRWLALQSCPPQPRGQSQCPLVWNQEP